MINEYFASGKIYKPAQNGKGHIQAGYFSHTYEADRMVKLSKVASEVIIRIANGYGVSEDMVHLETLTLVKQTTEPEDL